jgi:DNA adenine methylase
MSAEPITRPALRWFGGKWRLGPWIVAHLPPHDAYCEPYGGAASVLLRKPQAKLETWNDLHGRLVNFFTVLRSRPDELVRALELTPYARAEYEQAREQHPDPLEDARRFYVIGCQGRVGAAGAAERGRVHGWRYVVDQAARHGRPSYCEFTDLDHLHAIARRLRHVQVEHDDALAVLRRYDAAGVLHYVDPPYWDPTADFHSRYAHPMNTEAEHRALAGVLHACRGMVVLSGRPSALYDELYGGWVRVDRQALTDGGVLGAEALWLNPAAAAALDRARHRQLAFGETV